MKKLMVALVAVAFAAVAQAATFNWTASGTNASKTFYGPDATTIAGSIVYLFDVETIDQGALVTAIRGGSDVTTLGAIKSATLDTNSRLAATQVSYGEAPTKYNFYMAIVKDDYVFVSGSVASTAQASSIAAITYSGIKTATLNNFGTADYSAAGWYQTVPEPTSGLLLLLGMAGLALKRKQA